MAGTVGDDGQLLGYPASIESPIPALSVNARPACRRALDAGVPHKAKDGRSTVKLTTVAKRPMICR